MTRTKIVGYMMVAVAVLNTGVDLLDGNGFSLAAHLSDMATALAGAGFVFLRDAVAKMK